MSLLAVDGAARHDEPMAARFRRPARWAGGPLSLLLFALVATACTGGGDAAAGDPAPLFVVGARSATIDGAAGTLTLAGTEASAAWFAARTDGASGTMPTSELVDGWRATFEADPPQAGLQPVGVADSPAVFLYELLDAPTDEGDGNLTFHVRTIGPSGTAPTGATVQHVNLFVRGGDVTALPSAAAGDEQPAQPDR
jgi:hypothetical protein